MTELRASLAEVATLVDWPDDAAAATIAERDRGGSGRLRDLAEWLASTQGSAAPRPPARARLVVFGPVSASAAATADTVGAGVRSVVVEGDPFAAGAAAADAEIDEGADLIVVAAGPRAGAHDTAAVVVALLTGAEPVALLPRGAAAVDTGAWIAQAAYLRDTRRAVSALRTRPDDVLGALGDPVLHAVAAFVLTATARRTALILDGPVAVAAALLCQDAAPIARQWWQLADTSTDPVHGRAADEIGRDPLLHLGTTGGDGTAGLLTLPLLRSAAAAAAAAGIPA